MEQLKAGSAQVEITPTDSQFLFGYPYVKRYSTGVHDPILSSSLYIGNGRTEILFIANDIIFVTKAIVAKARIGIQQATGIPETNIMISATHTHSGPHTVNYLSNKADKAIPSVDTAYVKYMTRQIIKSGIAAYENKDIATAGLTIANDTGIGTNRRDPLGPSDHEVPVLTVKNKKSGNYIACMYISSMHPTVLHEDSTLISGDFPGFARIYLQENMVGRNCAVLHQTGPCGNQSPRHVISSNTFKEAQRLGNILGRAIESVLPNVDFRDSWPIKTSQELMLDLPRKKFQSVEKAQKHFDNAAKKFEILKKQKAPANIIRTAECDWFGAEEALTLAKMATKGLIENECSKCLPAEIQIFKIGRWTFVGWQGEIFVEYALEIKKCHPDTYIISMANGEFQGYIITEQSEKEGGYEASNCLFSSKAGACLVDKTLKELITMQN